MRICVFDKYFSTLGGGERHIGVVIELLLKKHEVTIIHSGTFDKADISKKLNLDLTGVTFIDIYHEHDLDPQVRTIVAELHTELFINATHFSQLTIPGIPNITLVFFPKYIYPWFISRKERLKYRIGQWLFGEYKQKIGFEGFSHEEHINRSFGRWSSDKSQILVDAKFNRIKIYYKNFQHAIMSNVVKSVRIGRLVDFQVDNQKISSQVAVFGPAAVEMEFESFVPAEINAGNGDTRILGLFITQVHIDTFSTITKLVLRLWRSNRFGNLLSRLFIKSACIGQQLEYGNFLKKNTLLLSNSRYTSKWIKRLYGSTIKPQILYPPTMTANALYASPNKKNYIISVGRFFTGDHSKKQLEMIKFFKKLYDTHPAARTYTFHVCGGTHKEERNQAYLDLCYRSSEGYPIEIHPDIRFDDLRQLYAESKIFWHAAGLYENENMYPDKFEHLGFTTIEAMVSGCVPIVIGVAGQLEVVKNNEDGFLWTSEDELIEKTHSVMQDESLRKRLASGALQRADDFNYEHFQKNVVNIFRQVNVEI